MSRYIGAAVLLFGLLLAGADVDGDLNNLILIVGIGALMVAGAVFAYIFPKLVKTKELINV